MSILVMGGIYTDFIFDVPRMPGVNDVVESSNFKLSPGGKALNIAVSTRLLHQQSVYVLGAVGSDVLSDQLIVHMQKVGLRPDYVKRVEGVSCSVVALFNTDLNTTSSIPYDKTGRCLNVNDLDNIPFNELKAVISTAEIDFDVIEACFRRAKDHDCQTFLNVAPIEPFLRDSFDWRHVDHIVLNEREARLLLQAEGDDLLARLYQFTGVQSICLTMGRHGGMLLRHGSEIIPFKAFEVEVVNTIGAGDAFLAGYAAGILSGASVEDALRVAAASGAITCQVASATNPALTMKMIDSR